MDLKAHYTMEKAGILQKVTTNLGGTLKLGIVTGLVAIVGFSLSIGPIKWQLIFISILMASASYISGFFLGFLFGIPKRSTNHDNGSDTSGYLLNTNLVDISDWLTKIIIGLGLVEIKHIPRLLQGMGEYVAGATNASGSNEGSVTVFTICCILYFSIFGLYYGYNYMRLFLSGAYRDADDNLLTKKIEEKDNQVKTIIKEFNKKYDATEERMKPILENQDVNTVSGNEDTTSNMYSLMDFDTFSKLVERAKEKMKKGSTFQKDDPNKGQWGGKAEANGRKLQAEVTPIGNDNEYFKIVMTVESTNPENKLRERDLVFFSLHDTFSPPYKAVTVKGGIAKLEVIVGGSFTVGVFTDKGQTELELDLAEVPGVSKEFKEK